MNAIEKYNAIMAGKSITDKEKEQQKVDNDIDFSQLSAVDKYNAIMSGNSQTKPKQAKKEPKKIRTTAEQAVEDLRNFNLSPKEGSIAKDIQEGIYATPKAIGQTLGSLPGEIYGLGKQILTDENFNKNMLASFLNAGKGIANIPSNTANYLDERGVLPEGAKGLFEHFDTNFRRKLGIPEETAGNSLLEGLLNPLNAIPAMRAFNTLPRRALASAGVGGAQAAGEGQNPITGALAQLAIGEGTPYAAHAVSKPVNRAIQNLIFREAEKRKLQKRADSPEDVLKRIELNYTTPEGQQMPIDLGTAIGDKFLQDMYKVSSSVPFSGAGYQQGMLKHLLEQKAAHEANLEHAGKMEENARLRELPEEALAAEGVELPKTEKEFHKSITEREREAQKLEREQESLAGEVEKLRHPTEEHPELIHGALKTARANVRETAKKLYEPSNEFKPNFNRMSQPKDFKARYESLYKKHQSDMIHAATWFGDQRELGAKLAKELRTAHTFFAKGKKSNVPLTLKDVNQHVKNIRGYANAARNAGNRYEASQLNELATALKDDAIDILNANGHQEIASSLKKADAYHQSHVLPFHMTREVERAATERNYKAPKEQELSRILKELGSSSSGAILDMLPKEVRNAILHEQLTAGRKGLTSKELHTVFSNKTFPREHAKNINPELHGLLEKYPELTNKIAKLRNTIKDLESLRSSHGKKLTADEALTEALNKKFGKSEAVEHGLTPHSHRNIYKFLSLGGLGYGASLHPIYALTALGLNRGITQALLNPKMLEAYLKGEKPLIQQPKYSEKLKNSLGRYRALGSVVSNTRPNQQ